MSERNVVFLVPYLGEWPVWMPLFLQSCAANPGADFRLLGDQPLAGPLPDNVRVDVMRVEELETRVRESLGLPFALRDPHKLCDLRPFFPALFPQITGSRAFWGYCDLDVVFGDLGRILDLSFLREADVFSAWDSRKLVGHFTLMRNAPAVAAVAYEIKDWRHRLAVVPGTTFMDEGGLTEALRAHPEIRWRHARGVAEEFASGQAAIGATLLHDGGVHELGIGGPVACVWDGRRTFLRAPGRPDVEVLYIHFMGLKRPYQWLSFDPARSSAPCWFSLLGFSNGTIDSTGLSALSHRATLIILRCLARSVAFLGRLLPPGLKASVLRPLRRA
jgi:hypothetical protein